MYLLAEFRAKEALPAILEAVSLPGELPFDLFGDAITEYLARILVTLASDQLDLFDKIIANRELNEYVRWEAVQAFEYLVRDGHLTQAQAVERLEQHLRQAVDNDDYEIVTPLVSGLIKLGPQAARDTIAAAYRQGFVETFMVGGLA